MKLENFPDLYFVLSVFVPGFIYNGVLTQFVPLRQNKEKELIILRILTATAFTYAICSPFIFIIVSNSTFVDHPARQAIAWFIIIFIVPVITGLARAFFIQNEGYDVFYKVLGLRSINPIPTGWDWVFGRVNSCNTNRPRD